VAQYVRMSTEHQQYSIDNQAESILLYARQHNMEVVRTYTDAGRSGLTAAHRPGLKQLIYDVEQGNPGYSVILVYDISRWGRFQDVDESAYYEYRCRRANVHVHYCAEPFANDGSLSATLLKTIKRTMAAEYSRELSARVFAGKARLIELGFRQGGTAGYGLRRLLVDHEGTPKGILRSGEEKSIATDRVILIPGPSKEIAIVNEVFQLFAIERWKPMKIARMLNERGIRYHDARLWTRDIIGNMVRNPKYIGANVSNRLSAKLRSRRVRNPPEMWIRRNDAFEAIVEPALFHQAQAVAASRPRFFTDEQLLERLREFLATNKRLTERLISNSLDMPSSEVYHLHFGGLSEAYRLIGYQPPRNLSYVERDRQLGPLRKRLIASVIGELDAVGAAVHQDPRTKLLVVNEGITMRVGIARCRALKRCLSWKVNLYSPLKPDFALIARLDTENRAILDYFCIPRSERVPKQMALKPGDDRSIAGYRFDDFRFLKNIAEIRG
jgi:DNA invertase Pin-like site-specific DNA recombinase